MEVELQWFPDSLLSFRRLLLINIPLIDYNKIRRTDLGNGPPKSVRRAISQACEPIEGEEGSRFIAKSLLGEPVLKGDVSKD